MLRMSPEVFDRIVAAVKPYIKKNDTNFRRSITVEERVTLTLFYLATGNHDATNLLVYMKYCLLLIHFFLPPLFDLCPILC